LTRATDVLATVGAAAILVSVWFFLLGTYAAGSL
jgi:hypothetical protein